MKATARSIVDMNLEVEALRRDESSLGKVKGEADRMFMFPEEGAESS